MEEKTNAAVGGGDKEQQQKNDDQENDDNVLKVFSRLLRESDQRENENKVKAKQMELQFSSLQGELNKIYQAYGVTLPRAAKSSSRAVTEDERPLIFHHFFTTPLSEPQTTLVQWNTLPKPMQEKIRAAHTNIDAKNENDDIVVEVPISMVQSVQEDEDEEAEKGLVSSMNMQRRPLSGNLTHKLTEYTRGVRGGRPFRPGGLDANEGARTSKKNSTKDQKEEDMAHDYCSPEHLERNKRVLQQDIRQSWTEGILLTAPPGADFDVGISWKDVYGEDLPKGGEEENDRQEEADYMENEKQQPQEAGYNRSNNFAAPKASLWDRKFFEDDSLFGDSSSSSEDDDDDSLDSEEDEEDDAKDEDRKDADTSSSFPTSTLAQDFKEDSGEGNVDDLLIELLALSDPLTRKKSRLTDLATNPLQLAQEQAQLLATSPSTTSKSSPSRKAWAVTKPLPIDDFYSLVPNPAMTWPFVLDDFQQQAVARLERNESIFVAAHTSAGKTVCAEYAIALCQQHCTRAVYTSPIKALSNQKFRDFCNRFGAENVGLVTGDLQINVDDSTCLIMTTEILRSMLYRGADLIRDIEWVIFDECHYINDSERGVVWEEVIIMLPQYVNMIFLSATTPNTFEFSDWIGRTKRKPVHVIRTNYRPVPLSHNLWAGLELHKVMEGQSGFLEKGYKNTKLALKPKDKKGGGGDKKKSDSKGSAPKFGGSKHLAWQVSGSKANWMSLVRYLQRENLTPTVVFSFSKKKCEEIAHMLRSLDLNTAAERGLVQGFALQTVARLSPSDAVLPQVLTVCEMVKRGIGVHHGGLLPILKEMVEILFSKNLIKVLFATETFAMGVNMPARSVVFNSIRKHDGVQFRELQPGEYTQMAGRAGRRGLDKVGTVIICCFGEEPPPLPLLRTMLTGSSTKLQSQFRLTYNMILNLLRVEDMSVEGMIKRSFSEFATQRALTANEYPRLLARGKKTLTKLEEEYKSSAESRMGGEDIEPYFSIATELLATNKELMTYILERGGDSPLEPGRLVVVNAARKHGYVRAPAIVVRTPEIQGARSATTTTFTQRDQSSGPRPAVCIVLLPQSYIKPSSEDEANKTPATLNFVGETHRRFYAIHEVDLGQILLVTAKKVKIDVPSVFKDHSSSGGGGRSPMDPFFKSSESRGFDNAFGGMMARGKKRDDDDFFGGKKSKKKSDEGQPMEVVIKALVEAEDLEHSGALEILNLKERVKQDKHILEYRQECARMEELVGEMREFKAHSHPNLEGHYALVERKETLRQRVETLNHLLSNESLQLFPDFLQRKNVLRALDYIDDNETVCVKGRVACEVNSCEELIATELVFEGVLNDLEPPEIVAALSSLVYQAKSGDDEEFDSELPVTLVECCERMKTIAMNLGQMQKEHGLDLDPAEYMDMSLKFGLVHVVYEWAIGVNFRNICELTDVQEGSIVRCITRLDELCREIRNCARVVGNPTLYRKMEAASMAIKRDIVFAASLYVT